MDKETDHAHILVGGNMEFKKCADILKLLKIDWSRQVLVHYNGVCNRRVYKSGALVGNHQSLTRDSLKWT